MSFFLASSASAQTALNVRDFGAKGDGTTLDQAAIQSAINRARSLGGATVYFPDGTYLVQPHNAPILFYSKLTLLGQSQKAVIKVMDNAGDYFKVFGNGTAVIEDFTMQNLTIDQNPLGNTTCNVQFGVLPQITLYINQFKNVLVENCSFIHTGTNCLMVNDRNGPGGITVRHNVFEFLPGLSREPDFDNTAVCLVCKGQQVLDNTFSERLASTRSAPITQRARTAIENDLGPAYTSGNTCDGYVGFVCVSVAGANNVTVTKNKVTRAEQAIKLEPFTDHLMHNITITDNYFQLNQKDRSSPFTAGVMTYQKKTSKGGVIGLTITGNRIEHQWDPVGHSMALATVTAGVSLCAMADLDSVVIDNNTIVNPPVHGIRLGVYNGYSRSHITITGNQILNPGLNKLAATGATGINVDGGAISDVTINSNRIDTAQQYGTYTPAFDGIRVQGARGVTIENNKISSVSKTAVQIATIDSAFVTDNTLTGLPSTASIGVLITGDTDDPKSIVVTNNPTSGFATPVRWSIATPPKKPQ